MSGPTQPAVPSGSVNEDQLRLESQRQVWFILFVDKNLKLCDPLSTGAIPERFVASE